MDSSARPGACQVTDNVFLTLIFSICYRTSFQNNYNFSKLERRLGETKTSSSNNSWNLCSNCCFLFEKCARGKGGLSGGLGKGDTLSFSLGRAFLLHLFCGHPRAPKNKIQALGSSILPPSGSPISISEGLDL